MVAAMVEAASKVTGRLFTTVFAGPYPAMGTTSASKLSYFFCTKEFNSAFFEKKHAVIVKIVALEGKSEVLYFVACWKPEVDKFEMERSFKYDYRFRAESLHDVVKFALAFKTPAVMKIALDDEGRLAVRLLTSKTLQVVQQHMPDVMNLTFAQLT